MPGRVCCPNALGESVCVNLSTDALNCGTCGRDCVAQRRGDSCVDFQCSCGSAEIGCTGGLSSVCCAPSVPGGPGYCANLGREPGNCGTCGFTCVPERANQCEGGMCTCGLSGAQCAGTAEDRCCQRDADPFACVDTTTAMDHCGVCGHRCNAFEICTAGVCTSTQPDAGITAPDTGTSDGGLDAGADAGLDTGLDAGTDAG